MKKIIIALLLTSSITLYAQTGSIKGKIISDKAQPVMGANIIVIGTNYGDASNDKGEFEIKNLPYGTYSIEASSIGFEKRRLTNVSVGASSRDMIIMLKETTIETQQVVISASKYEQKLEDLAVSTSIIQPDFFSSKNFLTFDAALRYIPGVQVNLEQVSIRGSSGYSKGAGARVMVAINGIPLYSGDTGDIVWELIPIADIERVEVIKGPASSLYGSSAIGGVINIVTKSAVRNSLTHFRSYFGVYDKPAHEIWDWSKKYRSFYGAEFTHSNSVENLGYTLSLKKFDNMSYRQNDYAKRIMGYIKLNYLFTQENQLTFFANFLNMNRGNFLYWKDSRNALVPKDEDNGNIVKSNRLFTGLIYHHHFNQNMTTDFKASYYRTKFDGYGLELTTSTANLFRGEALTNYKFSDVFILTAGTEFSYSKVNSNLFKNSTFKGVGAYAQAEFNGISKLIATLGFRYDFIKIDSINGKNAFTPRAGLNYKVSDDFILRASFGTGFRAPTPAEVFTTIGVGGGVNVKGNPDLTSETNISFEIGSRYQPYEILTLDLAAYSTNYKNYIEANLTKDGDIQFVNVSKARIQGLEINADYTIIPEFLKINLGYNYMWARDLSTEKALKYRPRHSLYSQLQITTFPFEFGVDFRYMSRIEEIDDLIVYPPIELVKDGDKRVAAYVTDLSIGYNFLISSVPAKVFLNAKNIFNYNYVEFIGNIAPIRNYSVSMELFF